MEAIRNITEMLFPVDLVNEWAHYYASMPLFPLFSTVHYILTACALRKEPGNLKVLCMVSTAHIHVLFGHVHSQIIKLS